MCVLVQLKSCLVALLVLTENSFDFKHFTGQNDAFTFLLVPFVGPVIKLLQQKEALN